MRLTRLVPALMAAAIAVAVSFKRAEAQAPQSPVYPSQITLSGTCSTPTTPASCSSTSYSVFSLTNAGGVSLQISNPNSNTLAWYVSNDGVNFVSTSLYTLSGTQVSNTTTAGLFQGPAQNQFIEVVVTAGGNSVTVFPYLSNKATLTGSSGGGGGGGSVTQGTVPWVTASVGGTSFLPGQTTLTTTSAASIVAARTGTAGTGRISVTIVNESTTAIALGGSGVTYSTGLILPGVVGASVTLPTTAAIYGALNASGSALVSYYEIY